MLIYSVSVTTIEIQVLVPVPSGPVRVGSSRLRHPNYLVILRGEIGLAKHAIAHHQGPFITTFSPDRFSGQDGIKSHSVRLDPSEVVQKPVATGNLDLRSLSPGLSWRGRALRREQPAKRD